MRDGLPTPSSPWYHFDRRATTRLGWCDADRPIVTLTDLDTLIQKSSAMTDDGSSDNDLRMGVSGGQRSLRHSQALK